MTKSIMTGTCAAIVGLATAMLGAQTATPQQAQTTSSEHRITVTGCLKAAAPSSADATGAATGGTTGTAGTTGTTAAGTTATGTAGAAATADAKFLLTDAAPSSADATGAAGTTSAATASGSAPTSTSSAKTYRLIANPSALSPHVGKKLELTGTLSDEAGAEGTSTSSGPEANAPKLKVESGKVVAASCTQQ